MKIIDILGAGALAATAIAALPAEAQRYGHDGYRDGRGWHDDGRHGWRDDGRRDWRDGRGYDRRYHDGGRRGYRHGYRVRTRTVCEWQRSYYGPVRRCFQVRR